jgi:hypothetical protein
MIAYNLPSLTMVFIQPTAAFTEALSIPLPANFYTPRTLWKFQYSGSVEAGASGTAQGYPAGTKFMRRVLFGDAIVSEMTGLSRGPYPIAFSDTLTIMMYADNLFDASSQGFNSVTPSYALNQDGFYLPQSAMAEACYSHSKGADPDRTKPISLQFWLEPISDPSPMYLEQATLVQVV